MWCCCGRKKSKQLEDQVKELVDKCALIANDQRHVEIENIRIRNMQWHLDDCYYALDCDVQHLHNKVQVALPKPSFLPGEHHQQSKREPRQMWSEL